MKNKFQLNETAAILAHRSANKLLRHLCILIFATIAFSPSSRAADEPVTTFVIERGPSPITSFSFSADLQQFVTLQASGIVQIFEVARNVKIAEWQAAGNSPEEFPTLTFNRPQVVFLPDSTVLAARGKEVAIHDPLSGKVLRRLESPLEPVTQLTLAPNGASVVGALKNNQGVIFWNTADATIVHRAISSPRPNQPSILTPRNPFMNPKPPTSIKPGFCRALSRDGSLFAVGLEYAQIDLWDLKNEKFLNTFQSSDAPARSSSSFATTVAFLANDRLAAVFDAQELSIFALTGKSIATADQPVTTLLRHAPMSGPDSFEIRSLAVSGDGRRMAVAGMRMGKRPGFFAPKGDFVFDVPMHGEIQIWNADDKKLLKTIKGKPSEKFALVTLDATGERIAAVTTGVLYTSRMTGAMQQGEELAPKGTPRVYIWNVKEN